MTTPHAPTPAMTQLQSLLVSATRAVFADSGLSLADENESTDAPRFQGDVSTVTAMVGYAGEKVRGSLLLLTTKEAAFKWTEIVGAEATDDSVADTVGEFSNMVLGKLKYELLMRGVVIMLSTPTTATGFALRFPDRATTEASWVRIEAVDAGPLYVRLDAAFEPGFALSEVAAPAEMPAGSGDELLF